VSISQITRDARIAVHLSNFEVINSGCWRWTGQRNLFTGYGMAGREYAHRFMYTHMVGEIPAGLTIDHLCRNRACVNPSHMEVVSLVENILRSENPMARNARKTHCIRGHEFTADNTIAVATSTKRGVGRKCRTCVLANQRERYRIVGRSDRRTTSAVAS